MKSKVIVILIVFLVTVSCEKRKYPAEKIKLEEEDIFFNGYIDGEQIDLRIGTDGYYCYSSYTQRADSIYIFEGELRKFDCNSCPAALRVELSDYRQRAPGAPVAADSAFGLGSRNIIPGLARPYTLKFASYSNKEISSVRWELSNGVSSQNTVMDCEFDQPGPQTVSLTVRTSGNCESRVVNRFFVGGETGLFACGIESGTVQSNNAQFTASTIGGKPPFHYTWNFGDGGSSNLPEPLHQFKYAGSYPVKLVIEDAENNVCESNYIHVAGNDNSSCAVNISVAHTGSRNAMLNGVKIQWTDQSNVIFGSDRITQPSDSYFEVVGSEEYERNERGEAGRLLTLRFKVLVSDGSRSVWFKSERAAIAVSYK